MTQFTLKLTNVNHAPRKTQLIAPLIRNRSIDDALIILDHTPKRAVECYIKILKNAQATARTVHNLKPDTLMIDEIFATKGIYTNRGYFRVRRVHNKRYRKSARHSRVKRIVRRSHIFVTISGQPRVKIDMSKNTSQLKSKDNGTKS